MVGGIDIALSGLLVVQGLATGFRISAFTDFERYVRDRCDQVMEEALRPGGQNVAAELLHALNSSIDSFFDTLRIRTVSKWFRRSASSNSLHILALICFGLTTLILFEVTARRTPHISLDAKFSGLVIVLLQLGLVALMTHQQRAVHRSCSEVVRNLEDKPFMRWFRDLQNLHEVERRLQLQIASAFGQHGWQATFVKYLSFSEGPKKKQIEVDQVAIKRGELAIIETKHWRSRPADATFWRVVDQMVEVRDASKAKWVFLVFESESTFALLDLPDKPWLKIANVNDLDQALWEVEIDEAREVR